MDNFEVIRYSPGFYSEWNDFVLTSKNGTFLFHRDFMDYHKDRFEDYSLMVFKRNKLIGVLPANIYENTIYSHQGLSYGGFVLDRDIKFNTVIEIFSEHLRYLDEQGFSSLILKEVPSIYSSIFTEEIKYLIFILNAKLLKRDTLSVIDLKNRLKISKDRLEGYKRGQKHGLVIKEENDFDLFWNEILIKNLENKHQVKPVHTLKEIMLLKERFPSNIRQFNVYNKKEIVAGTTIFESQNVAHSQYISGDKNKNKLGSLDFLHIYLIEEIFKNKKYFDFGCSNENNGLNINKGLQYWKEGFGARTLTQDFYEIKTSAYKALNKIFI